MSEKVYKTMSKVGAWNIVFGIIMIIVGLTVGIMQIIHGGKLLSDKKEIMFQESISKVIQDKKLLTYWC